MRDVIARSGSDEAIQALLRLKPHKAWIASGFALAMTGQSDWISLEPKPPREFRMGILRKSETMTKGKHTAIGLK